MPALTLVVFVASTGFGLAVALTALVIIGVRQEERRETLTDPRPPTIPALLARHVLGACRSRPPEPGDGRDAERRFEPRHRRG
ncbi:MAG TPA: hypothetical protein VFQ44_29635 [Streptosporangiaceae bacterium]|nr:hypothetical protein [Streptosporangiaceae bacterium]